MRVRHNSATDMRATIRQETLKGKAFPVYSHNVKNALPHPEVKTAVTEQASLNSFIIAIFLHLNL